MRLLLLVTLALLSGCLSGCAAFQKVQEATNSVVRDYCKTNAMDREILRMQVNQATAPNTVEIHCAADAVLSPDQIKALQDGQIK